eukprot:7114730-Pyramimonas_sp.AAC.1
MGDDFDLDAGARGKCAALAFTSDVAPVVVDEPRRAAMRADELATARACVSVEVKRAVAVEEDDRLTTEDIL